MIVQIVNLAHGITDKENIQWMIRYMEAAYLLETLGYTSGIECSPDFIDEIARLSTHDSRAYNNLMVGLARKAVNPEKTRYLDTVGGILLLARLLMFNKRGNSMDDVADYCKMDLQQRLLGYRVDCSGMDVPQMAQWLESICDEEDIVWSGGTYVYKIVGGRSVYIQDLDMTLNCKGTIAMVEFSVFGRLMRVHLHSDFGAWKVFIVDLAVPYLNKYVESE